MVKSSPDQRIAVLGPGKEHRKSPRLLGDQSEQIQTPRGQHHIESVIDSWSMFSGLKGSESCHRHFRADQVLLEPLAAGQVPKGSTMGDSVR